MTHQGLPPFYTFSAEVTQARRLMLPLVALESAVITHGLPAPENLQLARQMESIVRSEGAVPATVGLLDGKIHIGLSPAELERLAHAEHPCKVSRRDFSAVLAANTPGGTTVAGTMLAAHTAGLQVFATGGIGGVHRQASFDISADLPELARTPMLVVCAGAKAILDLPATLEYLETAGVPVIGYQTGEFPAFYSTGSGLPVSARVESPEEAAELARTHWALGLKSAILVAQPPPAGQALPNTQVEDLISQAVSQAEAEGIHGGALTPFLLGRMNTLSGGASVRTNLALLHNNARLAARIAVALNPRPGMI